MTTTHITIPRNHTRRIAGIREIATRATVHSENNQFVAVAVTPAAAWTALDTYDFARLVEDEPGRKWTVSVHSNLWYHLFADAADAADAAAAAPPVPR